MDTAPSSGGRPPGSHSLGPSGLTARQEAVLDAIEDWTARMGYPPSLREIGRAVGLSSTSSVSHQVHALERLGYLRRDPHRPRVYVPTDRADGDSPFLADADLPGAPVLVPLVGQIAAGIPITAEEHVEEVLPIPPALLPASGSFFALKVRGDSMTGARILDGDTVVIRAAQAADHGDMVAALVDETEATVKRLHQGGRGGSWLMPANDAHQPIPATNARILGKVVAVLRSV